MQHTRHNDLHRCGGELEIGASNPQSCLRNGCTNEVSLTWEVRVADTLGVKITSERWVMLTVMQLLLTITVYAASSST
jgi:hypothetical protein